MHAILAIAVKDIRLLLRDKVGLFFTFFFPVLIGVFFGTIFAGGGDGPSRISVCTVDDDGTSESRQFLDDLSKSEHFNAWPIASREEGLAKVRLGKASALVIVPKGFGDTDMSIFAGKPMELEVATDPSRSAESGMIKGLLTELVFQRLSSRFGDTGRMRAMAGKARATILGNQKLKPGEKSALGSFYDNLDTMLASIDALPANTDDTAPAATTGPDGKADKPRARSGFNPVNIKMLDVQPRPGNGPKNMYAVTFAQAIMWGVIGCCAGFAISLLTERTSGTLVRLRLSPLGWSAILAGKAVACFATTLFVGAMMLALAVIVFGVRPGSWPMLLLAMLCVACCFVGMMMLLAVIGRKAGSGQIGWSIMLVLTMVGGGSIPLFAMPGWLQKASGLSPVKWGILALEGGLWRDFSLAEMLLPCAILLGVGATGFVLGSRLFARDDAA